MMVKVYIAPTTFAETSRTPLDLIGSKSIKIDRNELGRKLDGEEIVHKLRNCDGVIAGTENYSEKVLSDLPGLTVISRLGVGLDNVDMLSTKKKGIKVFFTETSPALAVAELTLVLIFFVKSVYIINR